MRPDGGGQSNGMCVQYGGWPPLRLSLNKPRFFYPSRGTLDVKRLKADTSQTGSLRWGRKTFFFGFPVFHKVRNETRRPRNKCCRTINTKRRGCEGSDKCSFIRLWRRSKAQRVASEKAWSQIKTGTRNKNGYIRGGVIDRDCNA